MPDFALASIENRNDFFPPSVAYDTFLKVINNEQKRKKYNFINAHLNSKEKITPISELMMLFEWTNPNKNYNV